MSQRRTILLGLLVIPVVLLYLNLGSPYFTYDQTNGFQIISLVVAIPIVLLNYLEWQQPEALDEFVKPNFIAGISPDLGNVIRASSFGRLFLLVVGGFLILLMSANVFGAMQKALSPAPSETAEPRLEISSIQTAAVQTAQAEGVLNNGPTRTPSPSDEPTTTLEPGETREVEPTPIIQPGRPSPTPDTQNTAGPTSTTEPKATKSSKPTISPTPEPTDPILPDPVFLTGAGDETVALQKWDGPAILTATHDGDGAFTVTSYTNSSQKISLLINTVGYYVGTVPLDFLSTEETARFDVTASGLWELQIVPVEQGRIELVPSDIGGYGDEVIMLQGDTPDTLTYDANSASDAFIIYAYTATGRSTLVTKQAPASGSVNVPANTESLAIAATGSWAIIITAK